MKRHRSKKEETKSSRRGVPETAQDGNTDKESSCEETKERIPRLRVQTSLKFFLQGKKINWTAFASSRYEFFTLQPIFRVLVSFDMRSTWFHAAWLLGSSAA